jgi:diguanylate cyclase (GGDEF)-like protein
MPNRARLARPPRILIASDQNAGLRDLERFLGDHGYFVVRVYAGTPVLERARAVRPDVVVLDAKLADRESLDLSRTLRDDPVIGPSMPILLLVTGHPTPHDHLAALRAGIWELLPRPLNQNEVLLKVDTYVVAKAEADRAPQREMVDAATGLYTSQGLAHRARELILQASQHNTSAACVVFAPEFEVAPAGSGAVEATAELVPRVAQMFRADGRRSDAIGRVGSTEIAVLAPGTDAGGAVKLAERFRRAMLAGTAEAGAGPAIELRAGYGAVGNVRYTPVDPKNLLARAARAVQLARAEGKWIRESSERP